MERRTIGTRLAGAFRSRSTPGATDVDIAGRELGQRLDPTRWDLGESQRELIEMERLATQTELASDVADAINNPLAALMGRLQMRIEGSQSPDAEDQRLYALGRRIASVVQGMFELSRGTLQAREVPVAEIVEQALTPLRSEAELRGVKLVVSLEPELPNLFGDPALLLRALSALLDNALQASAGAAEVELKVQKLATASAVRFQILDAGPGIAPELRERVFAPFFTTRTGALGLGLALAKRIAHGHRGRLQLRGAPAGGCIATLELPVRPRSD